MRNQCLCGVLALWVFGAMAAERTFDFGELREGQTPPGFRSAVAGAGKPGDWKILLDAVPPLMERLTPQAASVSRQPVLAQLSQDPTDEHFPLLIWENETFDDFTLTTRFKTVRGVKEQMAGIAFRIQNESNYYVLRASSLGSTFRFYKVVNGERGNFIDAHVPIQSNIWHEISVKCKGSQIECALDGRPLEATINDTTFTSGRIGFWTKSDSVSYFATTRIVYKPREAPAQALVQTMLKKYTRLLGLKVFVRGSDPATTRLVGSDDGKELGQSGAKAESDVISQGMVYYGKDNNSVSVTLPMRDRNGDPIAAVRVVMRTFPGQTQDNAIVRAMPIVKEMEGRAQSLQDLVE